MLSSLTVTIVWRKIQCLEEGTAPDPRHRRSRDHDEMALARGRAPCDPGALRRSGQECDQKGKKVSTLLRELKELRSTQLPGRTYPPLVPWQQQSLCHSGLPCPLW